jgi:hypothetical protein
MADLANRWGVTANTVSRRLAYLGIKPTRQGNFRFLSAEQLELATRLHDHILAGKPMETFPRPDGEAALVARQVKPQAQVARQVDAEGLAALVATVMAQCTTPLPAADPLQRAKALAEAADNGLVLAVDELQALGVKGVDGFADGDLAYGYVFCKHTQRSRTLWTVARALATRPAVDAGGPPALAPSKAEKRVGFDVAAAITLEPVDHRGSRLFAINTLS